MSFVETPEEEVKILFPEETKSLFNIYKRIRDAVKRLEKEFGAEYEVSNITAGIKITASISPSFTGCVTATLAKKSLDSK